MLEARDHVLEQRRRARDLQVSGEIGTDLAALMLRDAVEGYILESEQKILEYLPDEDDESEQWSTEERIADWVWKHADLGVLEMNTQTESFVGVKSVIEAPDTLTERWSERRDDPIHGEQVQQYEQDYQIPEDVLIEAYRALNRFWNELGMDIEMQGKLPVDKL